MTNHESMAAISQTVKLALAEDVGSGDLTAALIPADSISQAQLICREAAILCGCDWFAETFAQLSTEVSIDWLHHDAESINPDSMICRLSGPTRVLLTAERTALNFLQLLSGTATITHAMRQQMGECKTRLLDTRKTIPGLRTAQKYAVRCGGGENHRMGLYDAILIKENHIKAAGSIANAVGQAKGKAQRVEVEVESLAELAEALQAEANIIMLDNFSLEDIQTAVDACAGRAFVEVSGNADEADLPALVATGVDYISIGALTKHVRAIDFSLLIE